MWLFLKLFVKGRSSVGWWSSAYEMVAGQYPFSGNTVYTKTLHFRDNRKCGHLYRFSIVSEWEQNWVKCTQLCSCYITIRSLHDHIICSIDKQDADLQEKQLWMEYVKALQKIFCVTYYTRFLKFVKLWILSKWFTGYLEAGNLHHICTNVDYSICYSWAKQLWNGQSRIEYYTYILIVFVIFIAHTCFKLFTQLEAYLIQL